MLQVNAAREQDRIDAAKEQDRIKKGKELLSCVAFALCFAAALGLIAYWTGRFIGKQNGHWCLLAWIVISFGLLLFAWPVSFWRPQIEKRLAAAKWKKTWRMVLRFASFGRIIWSLDNLWFIVFLVGVYATVSTIAEATIGGSQNLASAKVWLPAIRDIILAGFLAVVTSVVTSMFTSATGTVDALAHINARVGRCQPLMTDAANQIDASSDRLLAVISSLGVATFQKTILLASKSIPKEFPQTAQNFEKLVQACDTYNTSWLRPLGSPDSLVDRVRKQENLPRCSYMSAVMARYLESEVETHAYPGVYLNLTTFAYYVRTVKEVVMSLDQHDWLSRYEFYTTMPTWPSDIFRFQNSTDITEWLGFLRYYHDFHNGQKGKWMRYFLYYDERSSQDEQPPADQGEDPKTTDFPSMEEAQTDLREGVILVEGDNSWVPAEMEQSQIEEYIEHITDHDDSKRTKARNSPREGRGTLVAYDRNFKPCSGEPRRRFADCLLKYHVREDNFRFKRANGIIRRFREEIEAQGAAADNHTLTARFKLPSDIFAVKRINDDGTKEWKLLIARSISNKQMSSLGLALSPILEFDAMREGEGQANNEVATKVSAILDEIFSETDSKSYSEMRA